MSRVPTSWPIVPARWSIGRDVDDPSTWRGRPPTYAALSYQALFHGVELRYNGVNGNLKGK